MAETRLFQDRDGTWHGQSELTAALEAVGAHDCRILYIHSDLSFGIPNPSMGRTELLTNLFDAVSALGVPTLCVPTFTFSFCNGEDFDVRRSRSRMGAFNEYFRKRDDAVRSVDPLMSSAMVGVDRDVVENLGHHSIGAGSTFDKLHHKSGVKFLFLGVSPSKCFTYTHYVEERERVPYRYDRAFTGLITDGDRTYQDTYELFVRYGNVFPSTDRKLENYLVDRELIRRGSFGDGEISCIDEPTSYAVIAAHLRENVDCYLSAPHARQGLDPMFTVKDMVSL
jgi:aminoglycoside 3-N-acetyltransferase